jgi:hypothetical protein
MDDYDSRGDLPISCDRRRWCVCLMTGQSPSETGTSLIHQSVHAVALSSFLLSVVTALGHSLDVTVPCHLSHPHYRYRFLDVTDLPKASETKKSHFFFRCPTFLPCTASSYVLTYGRLIARNLTGI